MTEAGWTREKPTKNGWYWWRFDASTSATIVRIMVCGDGSLAEMSNNGHLLLAANFGGEWLGPITPDSYQQGRVADWWGLIRDIQKIRDSVENGIPPEHRPGFQRGCNEIIGLVLTYQKHAQAAQDEKGVGDANIKMS